ncbi:MAG: sensor domain-containing diguanylate cyclase, partial [Burkholderiales bacterium]|nr:sensor domain-containing diguanylate cyclase [Burkholderiales bacterium]
MHIRFKNIVGPRGLLRVVWPFAALTCCLVLLAALSMELLSATRAYVGGEGLWSKGQKQAAYALQRYADSRAPADFDDYLASIAIPLGDRKARLELEKAEPDPGVVRDGFLAGRNELDDIPGMIRLYRWFRNVGFMSRAIAIWTEADVLIVELTGIAGQLRQEISAPAPDPARITALLAGVDRLNRQLTPLEDDFSRTLGEASRLTRTLLILVVALASALLLAVAVLLTRRLLRQNAASAQVAELALRQGETQLRNVLQAVPFPILITRAAGHAIVYANDYAMRQFKLPRGEDPHAPSLMDLVAGRDRDSVLGSLGREGTLRMHEIQMRDSAGQPFWALVSAQSVNYQGEVCVLIGLYDITERKRRDDDIRRIAFRDTLTRLPNRASFDRNLARALMRAEASGKRMALLFVDLDQFKYINDTYGHKGGDRVLQAIAIRLANSVRKTDFVARLGGDEFVVLLPEFDDLEAVAGLAWKLLGRIS